MNGPGLVKEGADAVITPATPRSAHRSEALQDIRPVGVWPCSGPHPSVTKHDTTLDDDHFCKASTETARVRRGGRAMGSLLKGVSRIRWGELRDAAEAPAVGIPSLLSRIAHADEVTARLAIDELGESVCALGCVVGEVTATTVPFLLELVGAPQRTVQSRVDGPAGEHLPDRAMALRRRGGEGPRELHELPRATRLGGGRQGRRVHRSARSRRACLVCEAGGDSPSPEFAAGHG